MEKWVQVIIPVIIGVASTIGTYLFIFGRWTRGIETKLDTIARQLSSQISSLGISIRGVLDFQESLTTSLGASGVLKTDDIVKLASQQAKTYKELLTQVLTPTTNPITPEESKKLTSYLSKIEKGERLTRQEFDEFYDSVQKLKRERPNQEGTWILATIAGFLLGAYLSSKE